MEKPSVRTIDTSDYAVVVALLVNAYATEWGPDGWSEYRSEMELIAERDRDALVLVAARGDTVIGTVTLVQPSSPLRSVVDDEAAEIRLLAVLPTERRNGVAQELITHAITAAQAAGLRSLVLQSTRICRPHTTFTDGSASRGLSRTTSKSVAAFAHLATGLSFLDSRPASAFGRVEYVAKRRLEGITLGTLRSLCRWLGPTTSQQ